MMSYSAIHAGNVIRARTLIAESFKGNRALGHVPGQLACLVALGLCESVEGNVKKAMLLATLVEDSLDTGSHILMEPDSIVLNDLLTLGNKRFSKETLEKIFRNRQALRIEDILAQEFPSGV
jgi:hypothetical protein